MSPVPAPSANTPVVSARPVTISERNPQSVERRKAVRYPFHQDLEFQAARRQEKLSGVGRTLDFSSSGILFWSNQTVRPGNLLQVSIDWPVRLDGTCAMKIVAEGPVVRVSGNRVALRITRYEFRTRPSKVA